MPTFLRILIYSIPMPIPVAIGAHFVKVIVSEAIYNNSNFQKNLSIDDSMILHSKSCLIVHIFVVIV
jgi:hypothetical protein